MAPFVAVEASTRLLGLGNELLADDAFGVFVAREAQRRFGGELDVVCSSAAGFDLLDHLLGVSRLLVVDTIVTGRAGPGTVHILSADQLQPIPAVSPHFLGLFEVLAVGKRLNLPVPEEIVVVAVEAADCTTVGGAMHPEVRSAASSVMELVEQFLHRGGRPCSMHTPSGSP